VRVVRQLTLAALVAALVAALLASLIAARGHRQVPPHAAPKAGRALTKVLVVIIENKGFDRTRRDAPHLRALGDRYGLATNYRAVTHPSRPNYYAISAGSTFGVNDALTEVPGPTVMSRALDAGRTARVYMESMPAPCLAVNDGRYVARHNPWVLVRGEEADCRRNDVALAALYPDIDAGKLPNVGFVVPNNCNNAHDCPLSVADAWVNGQVRRIMRGPDWKAGRLLIVLTADEDDRREDNRLLTALLARQLSSTRVDTPMSHFALSRALAAFGHTAPLRDAAGAPDLVGVFGLRVGG
jgi:acid phosphatase